MTMKVACYKVAACHKLVQACNGSRLASELFVTADLWAKGEQPNNERAGRSDGTGVFSGAAERLL